MISQDVAMAAAWAAIEKIAAKELRRELLEPGAHYEVDLMLHGTVAGRRVVLEIEAALEVNHDGERSSGSILCNYSLNP